MSRSVMSTAECQDAVFEVAVELARQERRLAQIAAAIQLPPDFELDVELPSTTEIELCSRIAAVKGDYIQRSVEVLLEAAQLSDSELRVVFAQELTAARAQRSAEARCGCSTMTASPRPAASPPGSAAAEKLGHGGRERVCQRREERRILPKSKKPTPGNDAGSKEDTPPC